jgi:8-oxo-dGTP pyrophosphatase MutT (NUDIX family)
MADAVVPRPAASVILLRPAASDGFEVFMVRRHAGSRFAADVFVFPGGTVRADDHAERALARTPGLTADGAHARLVERGGEPPPSPELSFGFHLAGVRELLEEAGVLLASDERGAPLTETGPDLAHRLAEDRVRLQAGQVTLAELAEREQVFLACEQLTYFSHWITPACRPARPRSTVGSRRPRANGSPRSPASTGGRVAI